MPSLSVVIPVFQAELTIRRLYEQLVPELESITNQFEIILVEDFSRDNSWPIIRDLAACDGRVRGIRLRRNFGQHNAILCGIIVSRYDIIVTMDDDLQHPIEAVKLLVAKLDEGYDVVYGAPDKEQHDTLRNIASRLTKIMLSSVMGEESALKMSAFRAFRAELKRDFQHYRGIHVSIDVLLTWTTQRFTAIDIPHRPRNTGRSGYTFRKLARHALNTITGMSVLPLRIATIVGFGFTLFGLVVLGYVLFKYLVDGAVVPGFSFLACVIVIFSGAQLFSLGIIGEYLGRLYFRSFNRPPFVILETCGHSETG